MFLLSESGFKHCRSLKTLNLSACGLGRQKAKGLEILANLIHSSGVDHHFGLTSLVLRGNHITRGALRYIRKILSPKDGAVSQLASLDISYNRIGPTHRDPVSGGARLAEIITNMASFNLNSLKSFRCDHNNLNSFDAQNILRALRSQRGSVQKLEEVTIQEPNLRQPTVLRTDSTAVAKTSMGRLAGKLSIFSMIGSSGFQMSVVQTTDKGRRSRPRHPVFFQRGFTSDNHRDSILQEIEEEEADLNNFVLKRVDTKGQAPSKFQSQWGGMLRLASLATSHVSCFASRFSQYTLKT